MKTPEYYFVCSLVAGDESEGEVVGIGGGAQGDDATRFVVPVWSPRPPGGRGGFQGVSEASIVLRATTQPVDPLVAAELDHLFFSTNIRTAPDMRLVKNFTPPDFQAKNFTPLISPNLNSFGDNNTKK